MEESEENMSADDTCNSETYKSKPKKRSMLERELETNLTARVTSPISIGDGCSTSRYGRSRRLKNEVENIEVERSMKPHKSPRVEKSPKSSMQSPVYKMHASNSPIKMDLSKSEPHLDNQIENIYTENISLSRFGSAEKKNTPSKKYPKVYIRKDLIQTKDKDKETEETVVLIKNMFSPVKSTQKSQRKHSNKSNEKYGANRRLSNTSSVVKTLDFDEKKGKKDPEKKVSLSKNEMFELEAESEYQVGDLAWARMGSYPFWPCIITREPTSGLFVKKKLFGRNERNIYNVTFFGDNGRRSWIADSMLIPFRGLLEFEVSRSQMTPESRKKDPKLYMAYFISKRKIPQWTLSVEEAEMLLKEPKRLRIDILNSMLMRVNSVKIIPKPEKSKKVTRTDSDVSLSESLYDTLFSEDDTKGFDADRSRNRSRNKSLDVSDVVTACLDNMAAKTGITKIQRQSHMDRWLLKAKTKTPEKSQSKSQAVNKPAARSTKVKKLPKLNFTQKPYKFRNRNNESQNSDNLQSFTDDHERSDGCMELQKDLSEQETQSEKPFVSCLSEDLSIIDKLTDSKLDVSVNDNNCFNSQSDSPGHVKNENSIENKNVLNKLKQSLDSEDSNVLLSSHADVSDMSTSLEISRVNVPTNDIEMVSKTMDMCHSFLEITDDGIDQSIRVNEDSSKNRFYQSKLITSSPKCDNKEFVPISHKDETQETDCIDVHNNEIDKDTNRETFFLDKEETKNIKVGNDQNNTNQTQPNRVKDHADNGNTNNIILDIPLKENITCGGHEINAMECKKNPIVFTTASKDNSPEQENKKTPKFTHISNYIDGNDLMVSNCINDVNIQKDRDINTNENHIVLHAVSKDDSNFYTDKNYKKRNRNIDKSVNLSEPTDKKENNQLQESFIAPKSNNRRRITRSSKTNNDEVNDFILGIPNIVKINDRSNLKSKEQVAKNNTFTKNEMSNYQKEGNDIESKSIMLDPVDDPGKSNKYSSYDQSTKNMNYVKNIDNNNQLQNPIKYSMGTEHKLATEAKSMSLKNKQKEDTTKLSIISSNEKNKFEEVNNIYSLNKGKRINGVLHKEQNDFRPPPTDNISLSLKNEKKYNIEFQKYLELKQDSVMDEHPEMSQEDITSYLYKTWLYENGTKSDTNKANRLDHNILVKGTNSKANDKGRGRMKLRRKQPNDFNLTRNILSPTSSMLPAVNGISKDNDLDKVMTKSVKENLADFNEPEKRTVDFGHDDCSQNQTIPIVYDTVLRELPTHTRKHNMQFIKTLNVSNSSPKNDIIAIGTPGTSDLYTRQNNEILEDSHMQIAEDTDVKLKHITKSIDVTFNDKLLTCNAIIEYTQANDSNIKMSNKLAENIESKCHNSTDTVFIQGEKLHKDYEMTKNSLVNNKIIINANDVETKVNDSKETIAKDDNLPKDGEMSDDTQTGSKTETVTGSKKVIENNLCNLPENTNTEYYDNLRKDTEMPEDTQENTTNNLVRCTDNIETKLNYSSENTEAKDNLQKNSETSMNLRAKRKTETLITCAAGIGIQLNNSQEDFVIKDPSSEEHLISANMQASSNSLITCTKVIESKLNEMSETFAVDDNLQKECEMLEDNNETKTFIKCAKIIEPKLNLSFEIFAREDDNLQKCSQISQDTQKNKEINDLTKPAEDIKTKLNSSPGTFTKKDTNLQNDCKISADTQINTGTIALLKCTENVESEFNHSLKTFTTKNHSLRKANVILEDIQTNIKTKALIKCAEGIVSKMNESPESCTLENGDLQKETETSEDIQTDNEKTLLKCAEVSKVNPLLETLATKHDNLQKDETSDISGNIRTNDDTPVVKSFVNDVKINFSRKPVLDDTNLHSNAELSGIIAIRNSNTSTCKIVDLNRSIELITREECNNENKETTCETIYSKSINIRKNSSISKQTTEDKNIPDDPGFQKYLEFKQDTVIDEHPELSQQEVISYLYKTWLYEENIKSDKKKSDEVDQTSLVKGAQVHSDKQKTKKKLSRKKPGDFKDTKIQQSPTIGNQSLLQNGYHCFQNRNELLENPEIELETTKSTITSTEIVSTNNKEDVKTIKQKHSPKHETQDDVNIWESSEKNKVISEEKQLKEDVIDNSILSPESPVLPTGSKVQWKETHSEKQKDADVPTLQSHEITDTVTDDQDSDNLGNDEINMNDEILNDVTSFDSASITSTDSEMPLSIRKQRWKEKQREKCNNIHLLAQSLDKLKGNCNESNNREETHVEKDEKSSNEEPIKDFDNLDSVSITSTESDMSLSRRKQRWKEKQHQEDRKKVLEDTEFVRYLELRQDSVMDEHPELTEEEITDYLYKTWLYEENLKIDKKRVDEIDQTTLVKGVDPEPHMIKRIRKKFKAVKEDSQESFKVTEKFEVSPKEKSKRSHVRPYYNEEFSDTESEMGLFEIFRTKKKSTKQSTEDTGDSNTIAEEEIKSQVETDEITNTEEYVTDETDLVEMYFQELTSPKPNVFKGLIRERVCDICEKAGNLVKCKTCHCMFHIDCDRNLAKAPEELTPKGRKKRKYRRKPKNSEEKFADWEGHSDERTQDGNSDPNVSMESEREPIVADADEFEAKASAKMREMLGDLDKIAYDYESSKVAIPWNVTEPGKCQIVDVKLRAKTEEMDTSNFKCTNCEKFETPTCFVCKSPVSPKDKVEYRQKCQVAHCYKYYHLECLAHWPQTQFNVGDRFRKNKDCFEAMSCPRHVCHTCVSDDPRGCKTRFSGDKLARCVRCPATYHSFTKCLPAGSQILTGSQIVCPRHYENRPGKVPYHVNTGWCFICALGGTLICCEYCPTSFHAECLNIDPPEGGYMCEECETGRLPLYGEMVWVKLGHYRWWPGMILHPQQIPPNVLAVKHSLGEFVVRFFGQYDYYWVNRGRVFPFQEGDTGKISSQRSKIDAAFTMAVEHASRACEILKNAVLNDEEDQDIASSLLPPHYVKLKVNKPVGSLVGRRLDDESSLTQCECEPEPEPCGAYSQCLNRMLLTECGPSCRAGERCNNRAFEKRQYPKMEPYRTPHRGWGLRCLEPIRAGQFVIEYVGELLDEAEFRRRMRRAHEVREENFYFLTLDKERMIDAGPKGNLARFMNHSCEPNCETQKWTVLGDVRVGLFAIDDIPANSELTFNYNLESAGVEKKQCMCGAKRCAGYIGAKPKGDPQPKKHKVSVKRTYKKQKKVETSPVVRKQKRGRPPKPKELTEIEKDLLIIRSATHISSDSEYGEEGRGAKGGRPSDDDHGEGGKRRGPSDSEYSEGVKRGRPSDSDHSEEAKGAKRRGPSESEHSDDAKGVRRGRPSDETREKAKTAKRGRTSSENSEETRGAKKKRLPPTETLTICIKRVKTEGGDEFRID